MHGVGGHSHNAERRKLEAVIQNLHAKLQSFDDASTAELALKGYYYVGGSRGAGPVACFVVAVFLLAICWPVADKRIAELEMALVMREYDCASAKQATEDAIADGERVKAELTKCNSRLDEVQQRVRNRFAFVWGSCGDKVTSSLRTPLPRPGAR